jgi:SAM-dependent methyltransferase
VSLLTRARRRLRRIGARAVGAEADRLDPSGDEAPPAAVRTLSERVDAVSEQVGIARWWSGPRIWNDLGREPSAPLPPPGELLTPGAIERALREQDRSAQRSLLEGLSVDELEHEARLDRWGLPALEDREHYYDDPLVYWLSGLGDCLLIRRVADDFGVALRDGASFLDLGCSTGRVLRHVARREPDLATFGVDIQPQAVRWVRRNLGPRLCVFLGSTLPSLPFADGSIDLLFGGSVFTHIDDFEEGWLLEVRRVLRPGGLALLSFHPARVWEEMRDDPSHPLLSSVTSTPTRIEGQGIEVTDGVFDRPLPGSRVVFTAIDYPINNANLIHSEEWVRERWGRLFVVEEIIERAHGTHQDMAVLRRAA